MSAMDLMLEHKSGGKKSRRLVRVGEGAGLFVIGSSAEADLRLSGEGIGGCHAALRRSEGGWLVCDLTGGEATRIDGAPAVEREIEVDKPVRISIGGHELTVVARQKAQQLFTKEAAIEPAARAMHEAVIRDKGGKVIDVRLLPATKALRYRDGAEKRVLPAPTSANWISTSVGSRVVQQRLVGAQEAAAAEGFSIDRSLGKPLAIVAAVFLLFGLIGALFGHGASQEAALDDKSKDIIFNAKAIKMKREEANKLVKARAKKTQSMAKSEAPAAGAKAASAPEEATAPKSTARAAHALASLRSSGLSALVGRIAKRAAKQGVMVASIGVSPETKGAGNAFFSQGKSTVGGGGFAKEGTSYRLGGINTHGTGGGAGGTAKAGSGLSGGSVGTGDVALVDEETVIEGGLDREVIADVIKRNLGQIRYCYERQLSSNKDLYGKVMVRFTIGPGGEVGNPKIDNSTMKSALVEGCILRRVASWKFPLPKGGTTVNVAYPFLFKAVQ